MKVMIEFINSESIDYELPGNDFTLDVRKLLLQPTITINGNAVYKTDMIVKVVKADDQV